MILKRHTTKLIAVLSAVVLCLPAMAYTPDEELMQVKGYSPELITVTDTQRSRQEWKQPITPVLSPKQRFLHNIFYNNWTGSVDDFGSQIIREK
jgi:hypothetical protein